MIVGSVCRGSLKALRVPHTAEGTPPIGRHRPHHRGTGGDGLAIACTCVARAWAIGVGLGDSQKHQNHPIRRKASPNRPAVKRSRADRLRGMSFHGANTSPTKPTRASNASPVVVMILVITHPLVVHCRASQAP